MARFLVCLACLVSTWAAEWSNWDGSQSCAPSAIVHPASEKDVQQIVQSANAEGTTVKVFGGGHSYSNIALTGARQWGVSFASEGGMTTYSQSSVATPWKQGIMMNLDRMDAVLAVDKEALTVRVQAGIRLDRLYTELKQHGMALPATGGIREQSIAGAASTATHGSGLEFTSLSERIIGGRLVVANGTILPFGPTHPNLLRAASTSLGSLGVITELKLQCIPMYQIHTESSTLIDFANLSGLSQADEGLHDRMKWYWTPGQGQALVKRFSPCSGEHNKSNCVAWYEAISQLEVPDGLKTIESEFFMDVHLLQPVLAEFHQFVRRHADRLNPSVSWQLVGRYIAAESSWMAMAYGRESVALTMKMTCNESIPGSAPYKPLKFKPRLCTDSAVLNELDLFTPALEQIVYASGGRPHWGKINTANATFLSAQYPKYKEFIKLREEVDPNGVFMNAYLEQRLQIVAREEVSVKSQASEVNRTSLRGGA